MNYFRWFSETYREAARWNCLL